MARIPWMKSSDEKQCPFCAETIKKAAVVCRWCGRDLPVETEQEAAPAAPVAPAATSDAESTTGSSTSTSTSTSTGARPAPQSDDDTGPGPDAAAVPIAEPRRGGRLGSGWLSVVLAVLVLCTASLVGVQWYRAEHPQDGVAPNGQLTDSDARTGVLVAAADLSQRALSYNWKTLDQDMETAQAKMTPSFRKEYTSALEQVRANIKKNKVAVQATAVSSSIISATESKATALVFVNQTTTAAASRNQQLDQNRVVLTLTRSDGDWVVSKLTALG